MHAAAVKKPTRDFHGSRGESVGASGMPVLKPQYEYNQSLDDAEHDPRETFGTYGTVQLRHSNIHPFLSAMLQKQPSSDAFRLIGSSAGKMPIIPSRPTFLPEAGSRLKLAQQQQEKPHYSAVETIIRYPVDGSQPTLRQNPVLAYLFRYAR